MRFGSGDDSLNNLVERVWPVGSIFVSAVDTDPAVLFGFGTWAAFGAGRVLVGKDSGDTDFDALEETGGAKTHTHGLGTLATSAHAGGAVADHPSHTHDVASSLTTPDLFTSNTGGTGVSGRTGGPSAALAHSVTQPADHTLSGAPANASSLPPYIVVRFWRRTA